MLLRTWLKENGVSQDDFARKVGCAPSTIYRAAKGITRPIDFIDKIIEATDGEVSINELFWPERYSD